MAPGPARGVADMAADGFDPRIVPPAVVAFLQACGQAAPFHLGGGAALAWLLGQFPVEPLPQMIEPLTAKELREFRDALRERFRRMAVP